jgi:hypothetical protein
MIGGGGGWKKSSGMARSGPANDRPADRYNTQTSYSAAAPLEIAHGGSPIPPSPLHLKRHADASPSCGDMPGGLGTVRVDL